MKSILSFLKSNFFTLIFLLTIAEVCVGQTLRKPDIIVLKNNTKMEVSIQEVEESLIKYKKLTDPEGPLFSIKKTEIVSVIYGNGDVATFPDTTSEVFFSEGGNPKPVETYPKPVPKTKFDEIIFAQNPNQLRQSYQYYRSKSKRGLVSGIVWTVLGTISMGVGTALLVDNGYNYSSTYGYSTYNDNSGTGAALLIGGLIGGATFGTIGFVKAGKNGSKATRIRRELLRRHEPLAFKLSPGYNPVNQAGYLTLRMKF